ncbi:MAG: 3-deoxy-7-phosphoheptulonate synthase [Deltaproteobacteria bacterium]|nr:3-deoxy-7-phosphoheptulonate synthase [Deltaproteobacteria bacterium]
MFHVTDDLRVRRLRPVVPPAVVVDDNPLGDDAEAFVQESRRAIERVVRGEDRRLVAVVGPCSIHDVDAAEEYAARLRDVAARTADALFVVMRVYFEKPRTTVGWKGLINDPRLDGSYRINEGVVLARRLLIRLAEMGVPAGCEFLDVITPQYVADAVSWGAIGARTTESQVHRELASGLSMPVGFKNGTDGDVQIAIDALRAARHPQVFLGVTKQGLTAIVETNGNDACHVILRGGARPNYDEASVRDVASRLASAGFPPRVMVDCSHANSGKDAARQPFVAEDLARQIEGGSDAILGVMIESHLVGGRQDVIPGRALVRGQSITDACLGWDETVPVLERLAEAVRRRAR